MIDRKAADAGAAKAACAAMVAMAEAMAAIAIAEAAGSEKWKVEEFPLKLALICYGRPFGIIVLPKSGATLIYAAVPPGQSATVPDMLAGVASDMKLKSRRQEAP